MPKIATEACLQIDYAARRSRVAAILAESRLDALIVTALPNIYYLTGFTGSNGILLLDRESAVLFTDPRYQVQASQQAQCPTRIAYGPLAPAVASLILRKRYRRCGFEQTRLDYMTYAAFSGRLGRRRRLQPLAGRLEELRAVKSAEEILLIRRSAETTCRALARASRTIRVGIRETDLAAEIDYQLRRCGAEKPAFDTIVATGARSALPHAQPSAKTLRDNELLLIDMGAQRQAYASDLTRTFFVGRPSARLRRLYQAVLEAQHAALDTVRAGVFAGAVDHAARRALRAHGLDRHFVHSTGHGLGLEIHESPRIGKGEKVLLQAGMVVTIEPGVYDENLGGIRIEDTVLVTPAGCETLTPVSKEFQTL